MNAARYHGREDIRVEELETDPVGTGEVRIAVAACGICGSDLHEYAAGPLFIPDETPHPITNETLPIRMGHEFAGTVTEVGAGVTGTEVGDGVAVNPLLSCGDCAQCRAGQYHLCASTGYLGLSGGPGGFAESVVVDAARVVPLGEVPLEAGALVEPFAVALHAVRRSGLRAGDTVAVFGGGPIGLAVVQCARAAGAGTVFLSEPRAARRERAADCGADECIDPTETDAVRAIKSTTDGGVDIAFEAAGVAAAFTDSVRATAPQGRTTVVSLWEEAVTTNPNHIVLAEKTVTGSVAYHGPDVDGEFEMVVQLLVDGRLDPDPLVTGRLPLDRITEGFDRLRDPESDDVKLLVEPNR
ncbi:2,3-butanediol dehydrogenase [Natronomonas sp. EA1]|uniref:2,3-butanediol dehydrogenase n=1 Tax=Natronomonas sp. EA1 TaxID=3421655 RepID=UPI003EBDF20C